MTKTRYRVGETANLDAFPRGTKVGHEIELTEAQALYERDMGRITAVEEKVEAAPVALPPPVEAGSVALKPGRAR